MPNFFDEMYAGGTDNIRDHYREFEAWLATQAPETVARKRAEADLIFRRVGITFAVYGNEAGTERVIPFDIVPRIITAAEWAQMEAGLVQRVLHAEHAYPCYLSQPQYRQGWHRARQR